jgi:hypothetical protein
VANAVQKLVQGKEGRSMRQPHKKHFKAGARVNAADDFIKTTTEALIQSHQIGIARLLHHFEHDCELVIRRVQEAGRFGAYFCNHQVAEQGQEISCQVGDIEALIGEFRNSLQASVTITAQQRLTDIE